MMTKPVRSIHLPGATVLESLRERASAVLQSWGREWIAGWSAHATALGNLRVTAPVEPREPGDSWEQFGGIWFRCGLAETEELASSITGEPQTTGSGLADDWMRDLVDRAWRSRNEMLSAGLAGRAVDGAPLQVTSALPSGLFEFGSGAVEISCKPLGLDAIADNTVWRTIAPPARARDSNRNRLVPLETALRAHRTNARLDVMLGSVDLELASLSDLRCGDVLNLPSRLDEGITVLCEGRPLTRALLGAVRGRKCIRLLGHQT